MECTSQEVIKCASIMFQILKYENICHWIHIQWEREMNTMDFIMAITIINVICSACVQFIYICHPTWKSIFNYLFSFASSSSIQFFHRLIFFPLHIYSTQHTHEHITSLQWFTIIVVFAHIFHSGKSNCECILFFRFTFYIPIHISMLFFLFTAKKTAWILIN